MLFQANKPSQSLFYYKLDWQDQVYQEAKFQRLVDSSFDAVEAAAPFPAFPEEIPNKKIIIQVPVIYTIR